MPHYNSNKKAFDSLKLTMVGDPEDINCWSGTPFYILKGLQEEGIKSKSIDTSYGKYDTKKWRWNLWKTLRTGQPRGFQYSDYYQEQFLAPHLRKNDLIFSLNTQIPSAELVHSNNLRVLHYDDSSVYQLYHDPNYYWLRLHPNDFEWVFEKEKAALQASHLVAGMTSAATESFIKDYGISEKKCRTIIGGCNIELPNEYIFPVANFGKKDTFQIGLIATDPEFKGYNQLRKIVESLNNQGLKVELHLIGNPPKSTASFLKYHGRINKLTETNRFIKTVRNFDIGFLYPKFEAFGITVLEYLRLGVPVAGLANFGPFDTIPPDAGFRLTKEQSLEEISQLFKTYFETTDQQYQFQKNAQKWSKLLTWRRAIIEWKEWYETGEIKFPVLPRIGLKAHEEALSYY